MGKPLGFICLLLSCLTSYAQQGSQPAPSCLVVKNIGSHAFRNVLLGGIAGALVSKEQYQVLRVVNYPAVKIGEKFHGADLQTIQAGGVKVSILNKRATVDDIVKACDATAAR